MSPSGPAARLGLDIGATLAVGRLRLVGALVVLPSSIVFALGGAPLHYTLGGLGALVSIGWGVAWARSRRAVDDADARYLELGDAGLLLVEGETRAALPWSDLRSLKVDEERLVLVLERRSGDALRIEPIWGGLGVYDLRDRVQAAYDGARSADDG